MLRVGGEGGREEGKKGGREEGTKIKGRRMVVNMKVYRFSDLCDCLLAPTTSDDYLPRQGSSVVNALCDRALSWVSTVQRL